jgi:Ca2+-binding RTX toxin-like protein
LFLLHSAVIGSLQVFLGTGTAVVIGFGFDTIVAGSGSSTINVLAGNQLVTLGSGADSVFGGPADTIVAGSGSAYIDGSWGFMSITVGTTGGSDMVVSGIGDTILGGAATSTVIGGAGDTIVTGSGIAKVNGLAGNETITLGSGMDTVYGGAGDTITGGSGSAYVDFIAGHSGARYFAVGSNSDSLGSDTVYNFSVSTGDRILGETSAQISTILATQSRDARGNTIIQLSDSSTMTLIGIHHIDSTFFA